MKTALLYLWLAQGGNKEKKTREERARRKHVKGTRKRWEDQLFFSCGCVRARTDGGESFTNREHVGGALGLDAPGPPTGIKQQH